MVEKDLKKIEKVINAELSSKVKNSLVENNELLVEIIEKDLIEVVQFLKSNDNCKFKQLMIFKFVFCNISIIALHLFY